MRHANRIRTLRPASTEAQDDATTRPPPLLVGPPAGRGSKVPATPVGPASGARRPPVVGAPQRDLRKVGWWPGKSGPARPDPARPDSTGPDLTRPRASRARADLRRRHGSRATVPRRRAGGPASHPARAATDRALGGRRRPRPRHRRRRVVLIWRATLAMSRAGLRAPCGVATPRCRPRWPQQSPPAPRRAPASGSRGDFRRGCRRRSTRSHCIRASPCSRRTG